MYITSSVQKGVQFDTSLKTVSNSFLYLQHTCFHSVYHKASTGIMKCYKIHFCVLIRIWTQVTIQHPLTYVNVLHNHSRAFWKSKANRNALRESKQLHTRRLTLTWYGFFLQEICEYQTAYFPSFFDELALNKRSCMFVTSITKE